MNLTTELSPACLPETPRPPVVPIPAVSRGPGHSAGYGLAALRRELQELVHTEHGENAA